MPSNGRPQLICCTAAGGRTEIDALAINARCAQRLQLGRMRGRSRTLTRRCAIQEPDIQLGRVMGLERNAAASKGKTQLFLFNRTVTSGENDPKGGAFAKCGVHFYARVEQLAQTLDDG